MVNLYLAYTAPINPSGATPVLTVDQCWQGLQRKVRNAPEFVGAIKICDVIDDKGDEVTREVAFANAPEKRIKEVCKSYKPMKVGTCPDPRRKKNKKVNVLSRVMA